jgi:Zn-dependent M28 family amino/carboxypeptidase
VRFAWWGGEESGLLGSRHHVQELNRTGELWRVALNLNFDMLGSPNFVSPPRPAPFSPTPRTYRV